MAEPLVAPMAEWRPLPRPLSATPLQYRIVNVHTMVGSLEGSERHFSIPGNPYSHFGLGKAGLAELWQWQNLRYRAASDLEGNPYSISIETEDDGPNKPIPPWTEAQCQALIQLIAWCCVTFDIPPIFVPDSTPIPHGLSVHRRGIDSYPDLYRSGWRQRNGLYYSKSRGKTCPTDIRIGQMNDRIVPGVIALLKPSLPTPVPQEEEDMLIVTNPRGQSLLVLGGTGTMGFSSSADKAAIRDAGVGEARVSEQQFDRFESLPRLG